MSARARAVWEARVNEVCREGREVVGRAQDIVAAAVAQQEAEWHSRVWAEQWSLEWQASRMLHEWGLGEQYYRADWSASANESTLSPVLGKRSRP